MSINKKTKARVGVRPRHDGGSSLCCEVLWSENTATEPDTRDRCGRWRGDAGGRLGTAIPLFIHLLGKHLLSKYYVSDTGSGDGCSPALHLQEPSIQQEKKYITQTVPTELRLRMQIQRKSGWPHRQAFVPMQVLDIVTQELPHCPNTWDRTKG